MEKGCYLSFSHQELLSFCTDFSLLVLLRCVSLLLISNVFIGSASILLEDEHNYSSTSFKDGCVCSKTLLWKNCRNHVEMMVLMFMMILTDCCCCISDERC